MPNIIVFFWPIRDETKFPMKLATKFIKFTIFKANLMDRLNFPASFMLSNTFTTHKNTAVIPESYCIIGNVIPMKVAFLYFL